MNAGPSAGDELRTVGSGDGLSLRRELARKGLHLLSTVVTVSYAAGVPRSLVLWVLAFALAVALAVEMGRSRSTRARIVFDSTVGGLLRDHERQGASGATWLIIALLAAVVWEVAGRARGRQTWLRTPAFLRRWGRFAVEISFGLINPALYLAILKPALPNL